MADDLVLDAERAILGTLLREPAAFEAVTAGLGVRDLLDTRHETVFTHQVAAWAGGQPTEPIALAQRLSDAGELTRAGGLPYLHTLVAAALPAANVGHYVAIVATAAERRRLARSGLMLAQAAEVDDAGRRRQLVADALAGVQASTVDDVGPSWSPIDLDPYLRGDVQRAQPTVGLCRRDGLRLLYPGKEHAIIGEMEAGKSWFCLASVAVELAAGNHVVYVHFEESDPTDTVERLVALGASADQIRKLFRFVGPYTRATSAMIARLHDPAPSLVVLDGQNEAMSLYGMKIREEDGAAAFRQALVKPFTAVGAAVLTADHVVKDPERRDRNALGSIHKGNALNGTLIMLENADPFGRGQRGRSHVFVTKDRPGQLRQRGRPTKLRGKTFMGELVVDDTQTFQPFLELTFWPPAAEGEDDADPAPDAGEAARVLAAVRQIASRGKPATVRAVRAAAGLGKDKVEDAIARLLLDDVLSETPGPRGSRIFTVAEDQLPGVAP